MHRNGQTSQDQDQDASGGRARAYLQGFLQENAAQLQAILCGYVVKMGLATGGDIEIVAAEIFQDAVIEALEHSDHFNPEMQPRAWFLAIAANILKRHRSRYAKRYRFEVLTSLLADRSEREQEYHVLDQLMPFGKYVPGPEQGLIAEEGARELLALVSPEDAQLLQLALVHGWDASSLSSTLGVPPGTVRVRLHRALKRLRQAWSVSEQRKEYKGYNG